MRGLNKDNSANVLVKKRRPMKLSGFLLEPGNTPKNSKSNPVLESEVIDERIVGLELTFL